MPMTRRSRTILHHAVELYLQEGKPASSGKIAKAIASEGVRAPSPATIRNELSKLESLGLLTKPHSSAGRVPTETGLRDYLDHGLRSRLHPWDRNRLQKATTDQDADLPTSLSHALSGLSGQMAVIAVPRLPRVALREVGLVRAAAGRFLVYFVFGANRVHQRLLELEFDLTDTELQTVQNMLNDQLSRRSVAEVRRWIRQELETERENKSSLRTRTLEVASKSLPEPELHLVVEGASNLASHPELGDLQRLHELLRAVEQRAALLELMDQILDHGGVQVILGSEHTVAQIAGLSCVGSAPTPAPSPGTGAVTLLGPTRMDYKRLVPLVDFAGKLLAECWDRDPDLG